MSISLSFGTSHLQDIFTKKMINIIDKIKRFKTLLTGWWYSHIPVLSNEKIRAITPYLLGMLILLLLLLLTVGCAANKKVTYIPTQTVEKIEYRDTTIHIRDTIRVPIPVERVVEVVPQLDTLKLETSVATATAYLDTNSRQLRGNITNKRTTLPAKIDTVFLVTYKNHYLEKPIIQEVEKPVPYVPKFAWICIIYTCTTVLLLIILGILKLKRII